MLVTGLSRVTVAQRVDSLLAAGLVHEAGEERSTGGRRPARLEFVHRHRVVLAAVLDTTHARIAVVDLSGQVLAERREPMAVSAGPDTVLTHVEKTLAELLDQLGLSSAGVAGTGISVPGPVDPATGRLSQPPIMPGWDDYPISDHVREWVDAPVLVANDANTIALGEHVTHHPDSPALCLFKVSTGIGCGIVVSGQVYTGIDGGAGDIGHVRLLGHDDVVCTCGSVGCLAAVASGNAVAGQLRACGVPATSGSDVRRLLDDGDPDAARLTREAGRVIGRIAAAVVCLLNPGVLVVMGDLASTPLITGLRETLYVNALPRATRHLKVTLGGLGEDAALVGLTTMVVEEVFSPASVDAQLAP
jgi:predicted NBD/HSP70 family sugar kinase